MSIVIPVKFAFAAHDLWFDPANSFAEAGDHVICETERGLEIGLATADSFEVPEEELEHELKSVVRIADDNDLALADKLAHKGDEALPIFREYANNLKLDMKPIAVEFLFSEDKAVFYFTAEDRVDFRQLVKDLSAHFHTRIDMRQIGVRDETRLIGGYAHCGQELCCCRFGGQFEPVSIRMAKEQDLPLNSSKISGVCGRLMCCLRYEFEAYKDFKCRAPKKKQLIDTPLGKAKIVEYNTPREMLRLRLENGKMFDVNLNEMTCSDSACTKSEETGCPCRPDTVKRETLDAIESPDIALALLELDRKNGDIEEEILPASDRIETSSPTRRYTEHAPERYQKKQPHGDELYKRESKRRKNEESVHVKRHHASTNEKNTSKEVHHRRHHMTSSDRNDAFLRAASGKEYKSDFQNSQKQEIASSHNSYNHSNNLSKHVKTKPAKKDTVHSNRRHHKLQQKSNFDYSKDKKIKEPVYNEHSSKQKTQRKATHESTKPSTPSVADQIASGQIKVAHRHPGDHGGESSSKKLSTKVHDGANYHSPSSHQSVRRKHRPHNSPEANKLHKE